MNVIPQRVKDAGVALTAPLARALIQGGVQPNVITTLGLKSDYGEILEIERDRLRLRLRAGDTSQGLVLCSNP